MKYLVMILLLVSCMNTEKNDAVVTPKKEYSFKWNKPDLTKILVREIKNSGLDKLLPKDAKEFGYKSGMDMVEFWGNILVQMMKYESSWKPETTYLEAFKDSKGKRVLSSGLFQISVESANNTKRGNCKAKQSDLIKADFNIWCSLRILKALIIERDINRLAGRGMVNGKIDWYGGARYWSVLRTPSKLASIKAAND